MRLFLSSRASSIFSSMPDCGSICGRKQSSSMRTLKIVGTGLGGHLMPGTNEGGKGRGEGKTAGGFPPSHNALYPTPPSPPAGPAPVCPTSVPLRGSLPAVHLREQPQPGCKCAELFWQRFRINGKPFLWLLSIVVLIKLNSCGAHMDVICKSHCSLQIKADGEISLLFLSHSSELW